MDRWLTIVIYYNRAEWVKLLSGAVATHVDGLTGLQYIDAFIFTTGETRGDNVKIHYKVNARVTFDEVMSYSKTYWENFLSGSPSAPARNAIPVNKSLFMNYPNNSFLFNIHQKSIDVKLYNKAAEVLATEILIVSSRVILLILKQDPGEFATNKFGIALQLYTIFFKTVLSGVTDMASFFTYFLRKYSQGLQDENLLLVLNRSFASQKNVLLQYFDAMLLGDKTEFSLSYWATHWESKLEGIVGQQQWHSGAAPAEAHPASHLQLSEQLKWDVFELLFHKINAQIGMDSELEFIFLVERSLRHLQETAR